MYTVSGYCWIGFTDQSSEGSWRWSDGTSIPYTKWGPLVPNGGTSENCAEIASAADPNYPNTWNDRECSWSRSFICNDAPPSTSPS